ncbi:MAG: AAA family ATPase, partial [Pirellulales bacterium]|nr:AAA family ATPase [Pirellulales bacterium]
MNDTTSANLQSAAELPLGLSGEERRIGNRYQVTRLPRKGRTAGRFLAKDVSTGEDFVIRQLSRSELSPGVSLRMECEAEILRKLRKPWLAGVREVVRDSDQLYVVQPLAPGTALHERLLCGPLELEDCLVVGRCLLSALKDAHAQGVLHGAVRPANVIVVDGSPLHAAVLTGFSLGYHPDPGSFAGEESLELALYCSPELAGALDHDVGETSDLYSAGIVLFECLAGRPPFGGSSVGAVLREHMTSRVPDLRSLGIDVPGALDELIQRLLRKDPRDRYQSAQAVLMDIESIATSLQRGLAESACVIGSHDRRPTLTEPAFVGRRHELDQLEKQIRQVVGGATRLVFLEAESGGGKTRMLAEVALRGVRAGMWVVRGQGTEQIGQQPLQVLTGIADHVAAAARSDPALGAAIYRRLGDHADGVAAVLPELAQALGWKVSGIAGPEAFAETRNIQALAALLDALGSVSRPALIILDDCQWADELTVKLIAHWQSNRSGPAATGPPAMLLVAFRSEEVGADHLLRRLRPDLHLKPAPFGAEEVRQLAESMAGPLPAEAVEVIARLADGSPFMASAVLRGMVESGALEAEPDGWRVEPMALANLQSSTRAAGFLSQRIDLLPQDSVDLLTIGAVLGKEFDLGLAARLMGMSGSE